MLANHLAHSRVQTISITNGEVSTISLLTLQTLFIYEHDPRTLESLAFVPIFIILSIQQTFQWLFWPFINFISPILITRFSLT